MNGVYDLELSPVQYDFATALVHMEIERRKRNEDHIKLILSPGSREGFRPNMSWPASTAEREAHVDKILIPMARLLPSVREIVRRPGKGGEFGFGTKLYGMGKVMAALSHECGRPLRCSGEKKERLITITLREAEHWPMRNSDVAEWVESAARLADRGYEIVFVRDSRVWNEPIAGFNTDFAAAHELNARAVLYGRAALNLFVNSGPAGFAMFANLPILVFKPICENHPASSSKNYVNHGMKIGGQYPNAPTWQRLIWKEDVADEIVPAVLEFMGS